MELSLTIHYNNGHDVYLLEYYTNLLHAYVDIFPQIPLHAGGFRLRRQMLTSRSHPMAVFTGCRDNGACPICEAEGKRHFFFTP